MEWTPIQSAQFEAAQEAISALMAIHSAMLAEERAKPIANEAKVLQIMESRGNLHRMRDTLTVADSEAIERTRRECSERVRAWYQSRLPPF